MRTALTAALAVIASAGVLAASASEADAQRIYTTLTNVDSTPSGAEVYLTEGPGVSGDQLLGVTPLTKVRIPRGAVKIRLSKDGYEDLVETLTIERATKSYVFNLRREVKPAVFEFIAAREFLGADVAVDGEVRGQLPVSITVSPGRHQVVVTKDGYDRWERWVEASENQRVTFDVSLRRAGAQEGELLATSNPSGASVRVNGAPRGQTPAVIDRLSPGPYLVEIALDGHQTVTRTVEVQPGQRVVVDAALEPVHASQSSVKIFADVSDATIHFDGEDVGLAPVTLSAVAPGDHLVEARTSDGGRARETITVRAGESMVVRLELLEDASRRGRLRVVANVPSASVAIDGGPNGTSPFVARDLEPGTYFVTVSADGYADWTQSVRVTAGETSEVVAELGQAGQIDVDTKSGGGAEVFVDGERVGRTPFVGDLPVGTRTVVLRRDDGAEESFKVAVGMDRIVRIRAAFGDEGGGDVSGDVSGGAAPTYPTRPMPFSALARPTGTGAADFGAGWPYFLQANVGGGVAQDMDLGVHVRLAFHVMNDLELRYKWTFARSSTLAASVEAGFGAGIGGEERDTFFGRILVKGSFLIGTSAAITARVQSYFYTDRVGPESQAATESRDGGASLLLGLSVEAKISDDWNLFILLDGDPVDSNRALFEVSPLSDTRLYGSIGVSYLF